MDPVTRFPVLKATLAAILASLVLTAPPPVVPCTTDSECLRLNPHIQEIDP